MTALALMNGLQQWRESYSAEQLHLDKITTSVHYAFGVLSESVYGICESTTILPLQHSLRLSGTIDERVRAAAPAPTMSCVRRPGRDV